MNDKPTNPTDNSVSADNPVQPNADFKAERIIPKKPVEEKGSLFNKFRHKSDDKPHQEPTLGQGDTAQPELNLEPIEPVVKPVVNADAPESAAPAQETPSAVVPPVAPKASWKKPETWGILSHLPAKHRRLVVALLILIVLLLLVLWLKPSNNTTVEALQNQNSNALPIEFQPLNQSEEQQTNQAAEGDNSAVANNTTESAVDNNAASAPQAEPSAPEAAPQANVEPNVNDSAQSAPPAVVLPKVVSKPAQPAERKVVTPAPKAQASKPAPKPAKPQPQVSKHTQPAQKAAPVVSAKPANKASSSAASGPVRTLEIPKGVTLMQVFRNNNLNISDVNAMTKANGANGALNRFKPGDKVRVQLNSQGRVSRLTLENGSSFTRNSDGSYSFKK
ncbi:OapA protein [Pasteurellaceae bacterium TAE3-ERU1]|nr:OapA protein [Pasteurellaceae bacterium TAE3-ERU1]